MGRHANGRKPPEGKKVHLRFTVIPELAEEAKHLAKERKMDLGEFLRAALRNELARPATQQQDTGQAA